MEGAGEEGKGIQVVRVAAVNARIYGQLCHWSASQGIQASHERQRDNEQALLAPVLIR